MIAQNKHQLNQTTFRQLSEHIQQTYPKGRFLGIADGKIVADAASFDELGKMLNVLGHESPDVLVVQAGEEYPESAVVFL